MGADPREPDAEQIPETPQRVVDSPDSDEHNRRMRDGEPPLLADVPPRARVLKNLRDRRRVIE